MKLRLLAGPRILTAISFGLSGLAFVAANLLLARRLPAEQYALVSLLVGVINVGVVAAPCGMDGAVARGSVRLTRARLGSVLGAGALVAVVGACYARFAYGVRLELAVLTLVSIAAGGITLVAAARFQALHAFGRSLLYLRSQDYALLLGAAVALAFGAQQALVPMIAMASAFALVAALAWRDVLRAVLPHQGESRLAWNEIGAYVSVQLAATLLVQLERLLTPSLLTLGDMATLGVVLALVGPPFRLMQMTVGYALQPRLRAAQSSAERRLLLVREGTLAAGAVVLASLVLWFATPLLVDLFLGGKYRVSQAVLLAALISGALKVASGFAKAAMTALASNRELAMISLISWIGIGIAVLGAMGGARFGLAGVIYGVASGWAIRVVAAGYYVGRQLCRA